MPQREQLTAFVPMSVEEMKARKWDAIDILLISGDAYVDHLMFGPPIIARVLMDEKKHLRYFESAAQKQGFIQRMGMIIASHFYRTEPDVVLTMETKGIPIALMTAKMPTWSILALFGLFMVFHILWALFVVPETKGKALEEINL